MTQQQHTPTPWHASGMYIERDTEVHSTESIAKTIDDNKLAPLPAIENAAFIVRACNSHDALVEALYKTTLILEGNLEVYGEGCRNSHDESAEVCTCDDWVAVAEGRASLALATEGSK